MNLTEFIPDPLISAFGWALLHSIWQGVVLAALLAFLARNRPTQVRYGLSIAALFGQMLAFAVTLLLVYDSRPSTTAYGQDAWTINRILTVAPPSPDWHQQLETLLPYVVTGWLVGAAALLLRLAGGWWLVQQWSRQGSTPAPEAWQTHLRRLAGHLGIDRTVRLVESARVSVPMTIGWLKPIILLPAGLLTGLSPRQIEAVLAHELAHIHRYDYLVNLLQSLVDILFFYHPAIWYISAKVRTEREHQCDDLAIRLTGEPVEYARALAAVETLRMTPRPTLALAFGGGRENLLERVKRVLGIAEEQTSPGLSAVWLLIGLLMVGSLAVGQKKTKAVDKEEIESRVEPIEVVEAVDVANAVEAEAAVEAAETRDTETGVEVEPDTIVDPKKAQRANELKRKMEAKEAEMERLGEKMEELARPMEEYGRRMEPLDQKIEELTRQMAPHEKKMEELARQMERLSEQMSQTQQRISKADKATQARLQKQLQAEQDRLTAMAQRMAEAVPTKELERLSREIHLQAEEKMRPYSDSMAIQSKRMSEMAEEMARHAADFDRMHREMRELDPEWGIEPALAPGTPAAPRKARSPKAAKPAGIKGQYWYNGRRYNRPEDMPRVPQPPAPAPAPAPAIAPMRGFAAPSAPAIAPRPAAPAKAPRPGTPVTPAPPAAPKPPKEAFFIQPSPFASPKLWAMEETGTRHQHSEGAHEYTLVEKR